MSLRIIDTSHIMMLPVSDVYISHMMLSASGEEHSQDWLDTAQNSRSPSLYEAPSLEIPPSIMNEPSLGLSPVTSMANLSSLVVQPTTQLTSIDKEDDELQQPPQASFNLDDSTTQDKGDEDEEEDVETQFDQLMNRGEYLRQLRLLALADEQERLAQQCTDAAACAQPAPYIHEEKKDGCFDNVVSVEELQDEIHILPNTNERMLNYNSYLKHQRYYDDLKHADMKYIDYGNMMNSKGEDGGQLIIEQRKSLGKGGLCWDAAYCLGEFVINREDEWNIQVDEKKMTRVVELGAGTGLCGLMIAKSVKCQIEITDLPELQRLMSDNVERNFSTASEDEPSKEKMVTTTHDGKAKGTISSRVLGWGNEEDYQGAPYDVIIGADIVTSLYDPHALAKTIWALCGSNTRIYISGKSRLDKPHEEFDVEMNKLFDKVEKVTKMNGRLKCQDVFVIVAEGKKPL